MPSFKVYKGSASDGIQESNTTKPELSGDQVLVKVAASGLCGTDLHYKGADMVLGHEGAGVIQQIGPDVKNLKLGDRVGWGYQADACGLCEQCLSGNDEYCPDRQIYGMANLDQGSFAEAAVWREAFLFKIPDNISNTDAAPLMCGGATVWNALHKYGLSSTSNVGIIGIGGLGHLAIQFASKMGMNVVVLSTNESKKDEALSLGASHFTVTRGKEKIDIGATKLDALLVTASVDIEWDAYIPLLKPQAMIIPLTVHFGNFSIPQYPLIGFGFRVQGTVISSRSELKKMLEFAARNDVRPVTMMFPLNKIGIEDSMRTLSEGKMRYRGVLVAK
ncbi:nadp-dependent alcohol dehydrogenase [Trichoderma arundinaceum]|uniref:Nadp-dependent alcohol dehydrogenase n=1 Tax=Trichoderma arundinaceum TaxID=490622 RepID=A0A395NGC1_TRIAR|nr:nadp-dependent alcohol dehydrogenase [Trichoderma arundinaceum]